MTSAVASPAVPPFVRLKLAFCVPFDAFTMGEFCAACLYVNVLFDSFSRTAPWQAPLIAWFAHSAIRALRVTAEIYTEWRDALRTGSFGNMSPDTITTNIDAAVSSEMVDVVVSAWGSAAIGPSYRIILTKETLTETFDIVDDMVVLNHLKPMLLAVFARSPDRYRLEWITVSPTSAPQTI